MFKNHPKGLYVLALANTGERFGYYTMMAIFLLFLQAKFGLDSDWSGQIYAIFLAVVYFLPMVGGWIADRWSYSKSVVLGMFVMFAGYLVIAMPTSIRSTTSLAILIGGLLLICIGTGLFKGNLQVMIGDLYDSPEHSSKRDSAFSIFYMAINIGSMFAPMMATFMTNKTMEAAGLVYNSELPALCNKYLDGSTSLAGKIVDIASAEGMDAAGNVAVFCNRYIETLSTGYGYAFAVACVSLIVSFLIYSLGKPTFRHILSEKKNEKGEPVSAGPALTPKQVRNRITALLIVFGVVIFFWMVFSQNGATLTEFAKSCTSSEAWGFTRIGFNVWALVTIVVCVYALFSAFQSRSVLGKVISWILFAGSVVGIIFFYITTDNPLTGVQPQEFQQFNPFYIVALTPVSLAFFGWLNKIGKEPSAPRKIGYGMIMAAVAYAVMVFGSIGLSGTKGAVSPNWLISTYLLLSFAELLLSPMGISFVSKVAPPKYKGAMMGCWFGATAIGNYLVSIPMLLWGKIPVWLVWTILISLCLLSALFIFAIMKKLEAATSDEPETPAALVADENRLASETEI